MSRSYRKFPVIKDSHHREKSPIKAKDFANRAVRRSKEIPTGKGSYKKIYDSYFISDYRWVGCMNETEVIRRWKNGDYYYMECRTPKEALWEWKKYYLRK